MQPETRYAKSGDVHVAYQVLGEGPIDLVFVPGNISHLEYGWEHPSLAGFYRRLASFARLILFDKRGTGLSDRVSGTPSLETRMDDVRAVMDAVGSERAAVMGISEGAPMTVLFAATHPERVAAAVLYGSMIAGRWSPETPWARTPEQLEELLDRVERGWGMQALADSALEREAPSMIDDVEFRRWWATRMRLSASPGSVVALYRMNSEIDIRHVLPSIRVPVLILHRRDEFLDVRAARYLAQRVPGARYVELAGADHLPWVGDTDAVVREVEQFVTGLWSDGGWEAADPDRVLATVLFTDIVGATEHAAELGDRAWRELLEAHHAVVRRQLVRFRGTEIDTAGDGFFASFDGPARAVRCACAVVEAVRELGIDVRAGLHTGECELVGDKVAGIAVHTGARVAAQADSGEVLVSSTVKDLVAGSGIRFEDRGVCVLKGVPGKWRPVCRRARAGASGVEQVGTARPPAGRPHDFMRSARLDGRTIAFAHPTRRRPSVTAESTPERRHKGPDRLKPSPASAPASLAPPTGRRRARHCSRGHGSGGS